MKFGRQIKGGPRKFANKAMKKFSFGSKKVAHGATFLGDAMEKAGMATGNPQLSQAGALVSEGGGLVGDAGSVVEKVRTVRTSDDLAEAITDGVVLAARGAQFGAKVNMLVQ